MSENLGKELPDEVLSIISAERNGSQNLAVFLVSIDGGGYPHCAMLSPFQICASERGEFYFVVYSESGTCGNILRNGRTTFIFQASGGAFYVRCKSEPVDVDYDTGEKARERLFKAYDMEVLRDFSDRASLINYTMFDLTYIGETYETGFIRLKKMVKSLSGKES